MIEQRSLDELRRGVLMIPTLDGQSIKRASPWDRLARWRWGASAKQDTRVCEILTKALAAEEGSGELVDAAYAFYQRHKANIKLVSLHTHLIARIASMRFKIPFDRFIQGEKATPLLNFIRANKLHRVVPKADERACGSAFLIKRGEAFIRSKTGESFLDSKEDVELVLKALESDETSDVEVVQKLRELRDSYTAAPRMRDPTNVRETVYRTYCEYILLPKYKEEGRFAEILSNMETNPFGYEATLQAYKEEASPDNEKRLVLRYLEYNRPSNWEAVMEQFVDALQKGDSHYVKFEDDQKLLRVARLREELSLFDFSYEAVKKVRVDNDGKMISQTYLADGLEAHDPVGWETLPPAYKEYVTPDEQSPQYFIRIASIMPDYLEDSILRRVFKLLKRIFDPTAHGHSWLELGQSDNFGKTVHITSVGFFPRRDKRPSLEVPDHYIYLPVPPPRRIQTRNIEIPYDIYLLVSRYIIAIQQLAKNGGDTKVLKIGKPGDADCFSNEEVQRISTIYERARLGTCLTFAREMLDVAAEAGLDFRPEFLKTLFPLDAMPALDVVRSRVKHTILLRRVVNAITLLFMVQIPAFTRSFVRRRRV